VASPSRIGRFEIVRELGRGAMGLVYLAHDPKIDRQVAIKTIQRNTALPESESDESHQRFLREAQAAGKLIHPGIVTIFDVGDDQGLSYIAMEYIEGITLEGATKPGRLLPIETAVKMVQQACEALDHAHQNKVIHRDVKPANLMVIGGRQLKIMDFGLAKNPSANLTSAGTLVGTPNYMSPEQIMGRALDGRSDLFSLGVVLYELLTGERPFGGDTISTIIYKILHEIPKPPETVNPRVPGMLRDVVLRAIEKDPAKRFQTGQELAAALQGYLDTVSPQMLSGQMRSSGVRSGAGSMAAGRPVVDDPSMSRSSTRPSIRKPPERRAAPPPPRRRSFAVPGVLLLIAVVVGAGLYLTWPQVAALAGWSSPGSDGRRGSGGPAEAVPPVKSQDLGAQPVGPDVSLPSALPQGEVVSIRVDTQPPGGRILLDGAEVTGGTVVLPKADATVHEITVTNDCFEDQRPVRSTDPESILIPLKTPKLHKIRVSSSPPGARIGVDGHEMPTPAPADINVAACEAHALTAKLSGYKDGTLRFGADTVWAGVSPVEFAMEKLPDGSLVVKAPYALDVLEGGKPLGNSASPVRLPAGRHSLKLVNSDLFVEVQADVDVPAGGTVTPAVTLPGLGELTVFANPSNGGVLVNGRKIGLLPITGFQLAEGRYEVKVVLDSGQEEARTVLVMSGRTTTEKFILK